MKIPRKYFSRKAPTRHLNADACREYRWSRVRVLPRAKQFVFHMLTTCCNNGIIPNFIKFKFSTIYKFNTYNIQCNLLKKEIKFKNKQIFQLNFQINKLNFRLFYLFQNHDHLDIFHNWKNFLKIV